MKLFDRNGNKPTDVAPNGKGIAQSTVETGQEASASAKGDAREIARDLAGMRLPKRTKVAAVVALAVVAILSFTVIGDIASNPETHAQTIGALDKSKENVALMTIGALGVSTAANMLPADAGKSVSDVLSQITAGLAVVLAVILLEKYLLTVFGFAAFKVLIPVGCLPCRAAQNPRRRSRHPGLVDDMQYVTKRLWHTMRPNSLKPTGISWPPDALTFTQREAL